MPVIEPVASAFERIFVEPPLTTMFELVATVPPKTIPPVNAIEPADTIDALRQEYPVVTGVSVN